MGSKLEKILSQRYIPNVPEYMAENIINVARFSKKEDKALVRFVLDWMLPNPAYALSVALVLGVFIGWQIPAEYDYDYYMTATAIIYDEGNIL